MDDRLRIDTTISPLAPGDLAMVMAKSPENRFAFATWLIFFRDHGRFPRGPSDLRAHEERFHADIYARLSPAIRERLDGLLGYMEVLDVPIIAPRPLLRLRGNPGKPSLASVQEELAKLELIRGIDPIGLFDHASARDLERCRQRVMVEAP